MNAIKALLLSITLMGATHAAQANEIVVPAKWIDGLGYVVTVHFGPKDGGGNVQCVVDTGAAATVVNSVIYDHIAKDVGHIDGKGAEMVTASGAVIKARTMLVDRVAVGDAEAGGVEVVGLPQKDTDCLLGQTFYRRFAGVVISNVDNAIGFVPLVTPVASK